MKTNKIPRRNKKNLLYIFSRFKFKTILLLVFSFSQPIDCSLSEERRLNSYSSRTSGRPASPIGVYIADMPSPGVITLGFSPLFASYENLILGDQMISPSYVSLYSPWFYNPFEANRVAPLQKLSSYQTAKIHYGITDKLSFAVTTGYVLHNVKEQVFGGQTGANVLGQSAIETRGVSGLTSTLVMKIYEDAINRIQLNFGGSFPVGYNTAAVNSLTPSGITATFRAPYALQPGSRTLDFLPGILYVGNTNSFSWGIAYRGRLPITTNFQGWRPGSENQLHGWLGYEFLNGIENTIRLQHTVEKTTTGYDLFINGKTPGANPNFVGGQRLELFVGAIVDGAIIDNDNFSLAFEIGMPLYQAVNGPQLKKNLEAAFQIRWAYDNFGEKIFKK